MEDRVVDLLAFDPLLVSQTSFITNTLGNAARFEGLALIRSETHQLCAILRHADSFAVTHKGMV